MGQHQSTLAPPEIHDAPVRQRYVSGIPKSGQRHREVLDGALCLVHNHVRPEGFPDVGLGSSGFRAWVQEPSTRIEPCDCGWAPSLPVHYRVARLGGGR